MRLARSLKQLYLEVKLKISATTRKKEKVRQVCLGQSYQKVNGSLQLTVWILILLFAFVLSSKYTRLTWDVVFYIRD